MKLEKTGPTKLSKTALKETIKAIVQFSDLYSALPNKIPVLKAYLVSKMGDTIAWYTSYADSKKTVEFGLNVK